MTAVSDLRMCWVQFDCRLPNCVLYESVYQVCLDISVTKTYRIRWCYGIRVADRWRWRRDARLYTSHGAAAAVSCWRVRGVRFTWSPLARRHHGPFGFVRPPSVARWHTTAAVHVNNPLATVANTVLVSTYRRCLPPPPPPQPSRYILLLLLSLPSSPLLLLLLAAAATDAVVSLVPCV